MIKLILFDLGGVLCEDRNDLMLEKWLGKGTGLSRKELHKLVFSGAWHRLDKRLIKKKDAMKRLRATIPGAKHLGNSFDEIGNFYYPRADVIRYAKQLGKQVKIGVFSNMSVDLYKALKKHRLIGKSNEGRACAQVRSSSSTTRNATSILHDSEGGRRLSTIVLMN